MSDLGRCSSSASSPLPLAEAEADLLLPRCSIRLIENETGPSTVLASGGIKTWWLPDPTSNSRAKMQLIMTSVLLAFAAYVRAEQCVACPHTVAGQVLTLGCESTVGEHETLCHYYADGDTGPYCAYHKVGEFAGYCDYDGGDSDCPVYVGKTLSNCNAC